jgi:hypothetical protein
MKTNLGVFFFLKTKHKNTTQQVQVIEALTKRCLNLSGPNQTLQKDILRLIQFIPSKIL